VAGLHRSAFSITQDNSALIKDLRGAWVQPLLTWALCWREGPVQFSNEGAFS